MSTTKTSSKRRASDLDNSKSESGKRVAVDDDFDPDISNDIKGIMSALVQIKEKAQKDGQKKHEEKISSVASDLKSNMDGLKSKLEKERQNFQKAIFKSSKECENLLKNETAKLQALHDNFCKEKASHLLALKDVTDKYEEEKERLCARFEQLRKREKIMLSEYEKTCKAKIAELDDSLKKKKQDDKTFNILRKSLGSILGDASDEDFLPDD